MNTERRIVALLAIISVIGAGLVVGRVAMAAPPELPSVPVGVSDASESVTIQFLGDTMLGDGAQVLIDEHGFGAPLALVAGMLDGDVVIANAESPITTEPISAGPHKEYNYAMQPAAAAALRQAGVDVLQLANNHVMDRGASGLADTRHNARNAGLVTYGAGMDLQDAQAPLLINSPAATVAVVSFGEPFGPASTATDSSAGIPVLSRRQVEHSAALARAAGADAVIATVHWGDNYQPVNDAQRKYARIFAEAGYDAVIGTGPHVVQPVEVINGVPVLYSLGNFVFGSPGRFEKFQVEGYGVVASLTVRAHGEMSLALECIRTDNEVVSYRPSPCSPQESQALFAELGPAVEVGPDGIGRVVGGY